MRTIIKDLYSEYTRLADETVEVSGWVRTVRDSKTFGFIELNDGTFFRSVQIVFSDLG